ncbi:MAG: ABC transporter permease [Firmicutes bacterium]|nr:ABC transporter permease [Bacillota bacterium]
MGSYIVRRLGGAIVVLIGIAVITFLLSYALPSDPARMILGMRASQAEVNQLRIQMGLNLPLYEQFWRYFINLLHGNLGQSYQLDMPVTELIEQRLGLTAQLALAAWLFELIIGIPAGIIMALKDRGFLDHTLNVITLIGVSLAPFFLGLELLYWVAFKANLFPAGGSGGIMYVILPGLTYGITGAAYYARLLKTSMLDVLNSDYIRTARSKGAGMWRVVFGHALRNAMLPVMTYGATDIAALFGGIVVIEDVFGYAGVGSLAVNAISQTDVPVIMGTVIFAAVFVVLFNVVVDLLYGLVDPRISY